VTDLATYVPKYARIERALREQIAHLRPGDRLPSDTELCVAFGVSRMTARNAMQRLADEGLVERRPGLGSFVAQPPAHRRADRLMTFSREMARRGRIPSSRVLRVTVRPSQPDEAARMAVAEGEPVVVVRRLRCADGEPIALETAILDRRTEAAVMRADLAHGSLHAALAAAGFRPRRGTGTITAEAATLEDAALLAMPVGSPLLVERRTIDDVHGRRLEATESRYPADRYGLDVQFDVERPDNGAAGWTDDTTVEAER
jgi:GntR family transcriptional regulator